MGQFFHKAHTENPSSLEKPWSLLLYSDEVVPGNPLASRINRKVYAIYGSFAQRKTKLQCEDAWFIVTILPSTIVAELEASIGQVFAKLIEAIFLGPACDPRNGLYMPHTVTSMDVMLYLIWVALPKMASPGSKPSISGGLLVTSFACCAATSGPFLWIYHPIHQRKTYQGLM